MATRVYPEKRGLLQSSDRPDPAWLEAVTTLIPPSGKLVLDLGCGNGLYTQALAELGAAYVIGLDSAEEQLEQARQRCAGYRNLEFLRGNALATGLLAERYDIVFMRALLRDLQSAELRPCLIEAYRLLKPGGQLLIQDQTPEDLLEPGSRTHIWGYLFGRYPRLVDQRLLARCKREEVRQIMQDVGFREVQQRSLWETRGVYPNSSALAEELVNHVLSAPLYAMSEEEVNELLAYIAFLEEHLAQSEQAQGGEIIAQECWTLWYGRKAA
ncbi:class I SAM-dependent methyltransferase [Thermogemmatispora sp.]|uniref:class I SAM-dependent methyltransferase n=1 Tax=Thermogemmatispora sp. TaxID=1968838 RepID=UPI0035E4187A